ncbi:MAG TPA: TolC family protein, partial [Puia sp.]|nr:TolC family protein [Puia sp.]
KVSAAYLNVLAAQRLIVSQQHNLERAISFQTVVVARAKTGLNPGVDSSLANAEVSNARIALTNAIEYEQEQATQLAQLMQVAPRVDWVLDSLFVTRIPASLTNAPAQPLTEHPVLKFFRQRINVSNQEIKYLRTFNYPTFSLIGVLQDRGSGFPAGYGQNTDGYSGNYFNGVSFDRGNYLLGVGFVWNLTNPLRVHQQVVSQQYTSQGLQEEYGVINQELQAQLVLSENKIKNALDNYREAPIQVKAASDAYVQKETLYRNGLATIVDVTTAAFLLNQAETELDIADNNVWQALLYKAASSGDFGLFYNEF